MRWYSELLANGEVMSAVYVSVTVALLSTAISTVLGTMTAIGLSKSRKFMKEYLLNINNIPILNPEIVTAISLMLLFSSLAIPKGYLTMLLAHISFCTPFVITSVYPKVPGQCGDGFGGYAVSGADKGYPADDSPGDFCRSSAGIYDVL